MEDENSTNALNRLVKEKKNSEREKNWNVLMQKQISRKPLPVANTYEQ